METNVPRTDYTKQVTINAKSLHKTVQKTDLDLAETARLDFGCSLPQKYRQVDLPASRAILRCGEIYTHTLQPEELSDQRTPLTDLAGSPFYLFEGRWDETGPNAYAQ